MFKRLVTLSLLIAATVVVNTPARAATLTVSNLVCESQGAVFSCSASVSGGTGTYTSYVWGIAGPQDTFYTTDEPYFARRCVIGRSYSLNFRVTDSAGATAGGTAGVICRGWI